MDRCLLLIGIFFSTSCLGQLGDKLPNFDRERSTLSSEAFQQNRLFNSKGFSTISFTTTINSLTEYFDSDGRCFALSWKGFSHPNLQYYLGEYWYDYQNSLDKNSEKFHERNQIHEAGRVVVEKGGHLRAVTGRAYISALLPQGVSIADIQ